MPAPPITPSPHRFVLTNDTRGRPPSSRHSSQQFKPTPRFTFSSSIPHSHSDQSPALLTGKHETKCVTKPAIERRDTIDSSGLSESSSVEDAGPHHQGNDDGDDDDDDDDTIFPTGTKEDQGKEEEFQHLPTRPAKRPRRYYLTGNTDNANNNNNNDDDPIPSSSPSVALRFHNVEQPSSSTAATSSHHHPSIKPHTPFILPPQPPRSHSPPSILFSPHRTNRHQSSRFVVGGLASEVREWVIRSSSAGTGVGSGQGQRQGKYVQRVKVEETRSWEAGGGGGGCFVLVSRLADCADDDEDGEGGGGEERVETLVRMLLVGGGGGGGYQQKRVLEKGDIVGLKQPIWDVFLEGERWNVGVDWTIL